MKVLLVAINAKYIHSNLGIYSLKAYAQQRLGQAGESPVIIELAEYTINHQLEAILQDIYRRSPDIIGFSCYIWNISYIKAILADIKKILPNVHIWLGGPEVSYDGGRVLRESPAVTGIIKGEGEATFAELMAWYEKNWPIAGNWLAPEPENAAAHSALPCPAVATIPGLILPTSAGAPVETPLRPLLNLDELPFPYAHLDMQDLAHRIIYYESSRGCPFSCAYCLSSIDKTVRFRSIDLVKDELSFFLKASVPQVKFVDRTFNCKKSHAMAIWQFIRDRDNGITNFHFEIAADLLDEEELDLLSTMRPGLIQLEIGVQSTNARTLLAIRRKTDIERIRRITSRINAGHNVHQHLDLIAGLPWEDMESFRRSFDDVYKMEPEQLQLGFLKVLKGSYMEEIALENGIISSENPPYEVLSTRWLSYSDLLELKAIEDMVEVYYNSRQFTTTLTCLKEQYPTPYAMFAAMAAFYEAHGYTGISHSRLARYEILWGLIETLPVSREPFRDALMYDLYLRENIKSRPGFAPDQTPYREAIRAFFRREEEHPVYLRDYQGYDSRQLAKMAHLEVLSDKIPVLFDYKHRDPLTNNARAIRLPQLENEVQLC